jgi:hypothetical protein
MSKEGSDRQICRALGHLTLKATCWLAVWFCLFGAAIAVGLPGSLEERFANLVLLGLLPALGLIVTGYILDQALKRSCKFCQIVAARVARVQISLLARKRAGNWLQRLYSGKQGLRHFRGFLVQFSCLLIRGTARFLLKAQNFLREDHGFKHTNAPHFVSATPLGSRQTRPPAQNIHNRCVTEDSFHSGWASRSRSNR